MSISSQLELLTVDNTLVTKLSAVQDFQKFQDQYKRMVGDGVIQKKPYNLAPVNVLGATIPGQTTYQVMIG